MLVKKYLIYKRLIKEQKPGYLYKGRVLIFSRNNILGHNSCRRCVFYKDDKYTCKQYSILESRSFKGMTIETFCYRPKNTGLILKLRYHVLHLE
jgi:hypothetical protein